MAISDSCLVDALASYIGVYASDVSPYSPCEAAICKRRKKTDVMEEERVRPHVHGYDLFLLQT